MRHSAILSVAGLYSEGQPINRSFSSNSACLALALKRVKSAPLRACLIACALAMLVGCTSTPSIFKAYLDDVGATMQLSLIRGGQSVRNDLMNRYVDVVRFLRVDDIQLDTGERIAAVEVAAGYREIEVYYSWDHGTQRGLGPALIDYAAIQGSVNRVLRFNARAGETYTVRAEPLFEGRRQDITTLASVDFWVEDDKGNTVVTPERVRVRTKVSIN